MKKCEAFSFNEEKKSVIPNNGQDSGHKKYICILTVQHATALKKLFLGQTQFFV